jgi:hypothetical protein
MAIHGHPDELVVSVFKQQPAKGREVHEFRNTTVEGNQGTRSLRTHVSRPMEGCHALGNLRMDLL